ncbi:CGNR zinc finger domain-containing protein [Gymnodinialimonas sp. 2305UL16-5]|uniref:CGNR zinc finger domain-containing protein n=1 Tax=Gymnodinialimonas mytili TaxID=3126503 RepID=UPI0030988770
MNDLLRRPDTPVADHPFLAFVNSVADDGKTRESDLFDNGVELVGLLIQAGLGQALDVPENKDLASLIAFREAAFRVLSAAAAKQAPERDDVRHVERAMKTALSRAHVSFGSAGLAMQAGQGCGLQDVLALSFMDLTTSPEFPRLSECRRCTRLFIDRGRGRGRRWCDMARCGNRAKAESFRARRRAAKTD